MKVAVVGNGVAGVTAARTIRERDPDVGIVIYSDEPYHYYPRPRLIDFLAGGIEEPALFFYPEEWYREKNIDVHLNSKVVGIDTGRKTIELADGRRMDYDRLLLANGARPNVPPIEGVDQEGVFTLRTLEDAWRIKRLAQAGAPAVVIGGGLLGLESARALLGLGLRVSVLQNSDRLLPAQLDAEGAAFLRRAIEAQGIQVVLSAITKAISGNGRVSGIVLADGQQLPANLVLISAGVKSNTALAQGAGLAVNKGVVASTNLSTSVAEVFAAGDMAEVGGRVYGIVPAAIDQSRAAAESILGNTGVDYRGTVLSNTLQVMGIDLTSVGVVNPPDATFAELSWRDEPAGVYKKVVLQQGRAVGAILLGDKRSVPAISRMVKEKTDVARFADRLLNPEFDLKQVFA